MLIGSGFDRLEQRITNALCSGSLRSRELEFLQHISRKIGLYRERTLPERRASRLAIHDSHKLRECDSEFAPPSPGRPLAPAGRLLHLRHQRTLPNRSNWRELLLDSTTSVGLTRNRRGRSTSAKHLSQ